MTKRFLASLLLSIALLLPSGAVAGPFSSNKAAVSAQAVAEKPFLPTFEQVQVFSPLSTQPQIANPRYFATQETAEFLSTRFGSIAVELAPAINNLGANYILAAGPFKGQGAVYRMLVFPVGTFLKNGSGSVDGSVQAEFRINAGILADEYVRNPEADFPAQHFIYGYPPVEGKYLSNAEQGVWKILHQAADAAKVAKDAQDSAK